MKTNAQPVQPDSKLLAQVCQLGHFSTRKAAVNAALSEYVKVLKRQQLLSLHGKISWEGDLKRLRKSRNINASR